MSIPARWLTRQGMLLALVGVWVLLWGRLSLANVLSGALVAGILLVVFPLGAVKHVDHHLRLGAAARLLAHFVSELVVSSVVVARDVIRGPRAVRTGIVACPLRVDADGLTTFVANVLALSPGTMPIEVTQDPPVIYVHVLRVHDPDDVRRRVAKLEELAVSALGSSEMLALVREPRS